MMPVSLRLAIRQWLARPMRPVLCSLAIAAAVTLVLCIAAGFDSAKASLRVGIGQILGSADIHIRPVGKNYQMYLNQEILDFVRNQPEVELASGRLDDIQISLTHGQEHRWFHTVAIMPELDSKLRPLRFSSGGPLSGAQDEIIIDTTVAKLMSLEVGDTVTLNQDWNKPHTVHVVGITERPQIEIIAKPTVFVPIESVTTALGMPPRYRVLDLKIRPNANANEVARRISRQLNAGKPAKMVDVTSEEARQTKLDESFRAFNMGLAAIAVVATLCGSLIIGTTLSVGIQERIRQFGRLRCIGASRAQLATILLADSVLLMVMGTLAGLGAGYLLACQLVHLAPDIFLVFTVERQSLLTATGVGILATFSGSLIPLWQVARISPMQALRSAATPTSRKYIWSAAAAALFLFALQIMLWQIPNHERRTWVYIFAGAPCIFAGYCLLGPALLTLLEKFLAPLLGRIFGLRKELLREAWSRTPWRAGGMIAALMIGVTLFTTVQLRSLTMNHTLSFPAKFPDLFMYSYSYFPAARVDKPMSLSPEIAEYTALSLVTVKPAMGFAAGTSSLAYDPVNFVSIDPATFKKIIDVRFLEGDASGAWQKMAAGGCILISKEFKATHNLGVGDTMSFRAADGSAAKFTIVGVIASTGMDMARAYFDIGNAISEAAITSVMGSQDDAQKYFNVKGNKIVLANTVRGTSSDTVERIIRPRFTANGFESVSSVAMKEGITTIVSRVIDALSLIALSTLLIASLGVANMVIASTHARRYEFGVLRAIGAGRGQLVRIVLAEITIVALSAGMLGSLAGLHYVFMSTRVDRAMIGLTTPFVVALAPMAIAIGITLILGWLAAFVPALRAALSAQRTLLASGRE